jgi:hypothetical protein
MKSQFDKISTSNTSKTGITNKRRGALTLFAIAGAAAVLSLSAAPALAHAPSPVDPIISDHVQLPDLGNMPVVEQPEIPTPGLQINIPKLVLPGYYQLPDLSNDTADPGDADDQTAPGDAGDDAADPGDQPAATDDSTPTTESTATTDNAPTTDSTPTTEATVGQTATTEQQQSDDNDGSVEELPFTGADTTPWYIAGVAIALAGIAALMAVIGLRGRKAGN